MSDSVRDRVLTQALHEIPKHGFSDAMLAGAAERAGVTTREMLDAFPHGPGSLVEAFSHWADAQMAAAMTIDKSKSMRERVRNAVKTRIAALNPHKEAARRTAAFLALPQHATLAAQLTMRSVDQMWRAAGDRSSDFSYYTKRGLLAGVYGATLLYWLSDSSEQNAATWEFLDFRIENVMQIEKFRSAAQGAISKLPNPFTILANWRGGKR
jgi:ubiquinone biosynthesis protein COQ9